MYDEVIPIVYYTFIVEKNFIKYFVGTLPVLVSVLNSNSKIECLYTYLHCTNKYTGNFFQYRRWKLNVPMEILVPEDIDNVPAKVYVNCLYKNF